MFSITKSLKKAFTCILRWRSDVKLERVYPGPPGRAPFYGSLISHPHRHSRAPTDIILFSFFSSLFFFFWEHALTPTPALYYLFDIQFSQAQEDRPQPGFPD